MARFVLAACVMALMLSVANGQRSGPHDAKEKPSLLRKFHVHYTMPKTFVDVPQDSAGAGGASSYGGLTRTLLMVALLLFSVSHFISPLREASYDAETDDGLFDLDGDFEDADDVDFLEEQVSGPFLLATTAEVADHSVARALLVGEEEAGREQEWENEEEKEGDDVEGAKQVAEVAEEAVELDAESCVLLAQSSLFAYDSSDLEAATRLAERCFKEDKKQRIRAKAEQLLQARRARRWEDIHAKLDLSAFEVLEGTANLPRQAAPFAVAPKPEAEPVRRAAPKPPLSAIMAPDNENLPPPAVSAASLLSRAGERSTAAKRKQGGKQRRGSHEESEPQQPPLASLALVLPVVALAVRPTMSAAARRKLGKRRHRAISSFNVHKSKPGAGEASSPHCFAWPARRYDVIKSGPALLPRPELARNLFSAA